MNRVAECVAALIAEFNELGVSHQVDSDSRRCHTLNLRFRLYSVYKISTPRPQAPVMSMIPMEGRTPNRT